MKLITGLCLIFFMVIFATDASEVSERMKTDPFMAPFYTGKIFPTPQKVSYGNDFYDLSKTGIVLGEGLKEDDARLKLLLDRITRYGGKYEFVSSVDNDCKTIIFAGVNGLEVPPQVQGYSIKCLRENNKNIVKFAGKDKLGFTWAVNSIIQMIDYKEGRPVLRSIEVDDYPYIKNRAIYSCPGGPGIGRLGTAEYLPVLTKLNMLFFHPGQIRYSLRTKYSWKTPLPEERIKKIVKTGKYLTDLGIRWAPAIMPNTTDGVPEHQIRSNNEEDFNFVWNLAEPCLKAGSEFYLLYDDFRYPLSPEDKEEFGCAWKADAFFINRLHKKIKETYPEAGFMFCQPYYVTKSARAGGARPEDGAEYLRGIGKNIPEDVIMTWCGTHGHSGGQSQKDYDTFHALTNNHGLAFFQNTTDIKKHLYEYIYLTDQADFWLNHGRTKEWYKNLDIAGYNCQSVYGAMLWNAMLWNPDAYNAKEAAKEATCKLVGSDNYQNAGDFISALSYFDRFGTLARTPFAAKKIREIESKYAEAKQCYDKLNAAAKLWTYWFSGRTLNSIERVFIRRLKTNKKLMALVNPALELVDIAKKEVNFNKNTDQLLTCYELSAPRDCKKVLGKGAAWIYAGEQLSGSFQINPFPPETAYELLICGRRKKGEGNDKIEIKLNEKSVFKGLNPFSLQWSMKCFNINMLDLKRYNKISINNLGGSNDKSYFMLSFMVVRKTAENKKGKNE